MIMTHVDLIEKLLKYAYTLYFDLLCGRNCNLRYDLDEETDQIHRYNPAERDAKKAALG